MSWAVTVRVRDAVSPTRGSGIAGNLFRRLGDLRREGVRPAWPADGLAPPYTPAGRVGDQVCPVLGSQFTSNPGVGHHRGLAAASSLRGAIGGSAASAS